jgi:hypothetical protein
MKILRRNLHHIAWFILALILSACAQMPVQDTRPAQPSAVPFPTSTSTPISQPTLTPTTQPTALPMNEPLFQDPMGWYSFKIPRRWKPTGSPGAFSGSDGFVETGYLPERMFMPNSLDVCQWLANIETKQTYWISLDLRPDSCVLNTLPGVAPATKTWIIGNPMVSDIQRYIFIRVDVSHFGEITNSFAWLRPVTAIDHSIAQPGSPRPGDTAFWAAAAPLPANFTVKEYPLPPEMQTIDPWHNLFEIPPDAPKPVWKTGIPYVEPTWEIINRQIKPFGYEFRAENHEYLYQLIKAGKTLIEHAYKLTPDYPFITPAGDRITFKAYALVNADLPSPFDDNRNTVVYLVQNEGINLWQNGRPDSIDPQRPPIYADHQFLWVQVSDHYQVDVQTPQRDVLFSFTTFEAAGIPIYAFKSWNEHWLLQVSDFLIQDGTILNEKLGFEAIFDWGLLKEKPFYFFRKGPYIGISYDGHFLPLTYQEVPHGGCCGMVFNNPSNDGKTVRFYAKKNGQWNYVVIEAN